MRVFDNGARYRGELARELFDLDPAAYDNLTELLKQLRRPKLGERLNPGELARTLRDALPRLSAGEVAQLVEGWDRLEDLRRGVEQLEKSAVAVAGFTRRHWLPWARVVVRRRADEVAAATTQLDNTTRERREAETQLASARRRLGETGQEHERSREERNDRRTELRELINSGAYQDAVAATERADSLRREADGLAEKAAEAKAAAGAAAGTLADAVAAHAALRAHLGAAGNALRERRGRLDAGRRPLDQRRREIEAELEKVRSMTEEPPPPPALWRRRDRAGAVTGAPLWACARPRDDGPGRYSPRPTWDRAPGGADLAGQEPVFEP